MFYLLDADICSYAIRGVSTKLDMKLATAKPGTLAISSITRAELIFGVEKRGNPRALSKLVHGFLDRVAVIPWDTSAADHFARLRAQLERSGTPIGTFDTMVAGHALALKATLVTNNQKHFQKVATLKIENWSA